MKEMKMDYSKQGQEMFYREMDQQRIDIHALPCTDEVKVYGLVDETIERYCFNANE